MAIPISTSQTVRTTQRSLHGDVLALNGDDVDCSVSDHFERVADCIPDQIAVKTTRHQFTYGMLNSTANQIARALLAGNRAVDRPVTLLLERGAWLSAAILGVLKARGIYVVLNPLHPEARIQYILEDSQAPLMVTDSANFALARELTQNRLPLVNIDEIDPGLRSDNPGLPESAGGVASITYTSGSTGRPKGVIHSHRFLMHRRLAGKRLGIGVNDRVATVGSASSQFRSLLNGAGSFPWNVKEDGVALLADWLKYERITVFHAVPSVFRDFAATLTAGDDFPGLRLINLRGETVYRHDVELYKNRFGSHCVLVNELGASETGTIGQHLINKNTKVSGNIVPVGRVLDGRSVTLLDDQGEEVEAGQVGEITVRSRFLSPGYWRNPKLTEARFRPDPGGGDERIYATGDLGRMLPDGCLVHVGRKDTQVKIRAQRIELAEIEAALRHLKNISEAAVLAREDRPGEKRLVAYVVPADEPVPTVGELLGELAQSLPDYMFPTTFVTLSSLPLTPNGKIDRLALPPPGRGRPNLAVEYRAPQTEIQAALVKIWEELLELAPIGIDDNFFELGGQSLLAVRLLARIAEVFNQKLPLRVFFLAPTVRELAQWLRERPDEHAWPVLIPIQAHGTRPPLFCVAAPNTNALGFVFLARHLGPDQPVYGLQRQDPANAELYYSQTEYEGLAAEGVSALCQVWPEGPCLLCGFCEGAHIAFEMARQLAAAGRAVSLLAMFDAWPLENTRSRFRFHLAGILIRLRLGGLSGMVKIFRRKIVRVTGRAARETGPMEQTHGLPTDEIAAAAWRRWKQRMWPGRNFIPPVFSGRITVLRVRRQPWSRVRDCSLGWKARATDGVDVHEVSGEHKTILREPHVQALAARLTECISRSLTPASAKSNRPKEKSPPP